MKQMLLLLALVPFSLRAQVILQPWLEVFGTVNGQQLGKYVTGITPSANLPYKAAVSKVGSTGVYRLNSPIDTTVQQLFLGENLLTDDLNNDGFKDVVVSKTVGGYDTVFVYWGTATGIDTVAPLLIPGEGLDDKLVPGCIGDINNDSKPDLVLLAPGYSLDYGRVYVFLNPVQTAIPNAIASGDTVRSKLGRSCAIGDLNNDGFNDLIVRGNKTTGPQATWYDYVNIYWGVGIDTLDLRLGLQMRTASQNSEGLACFDVNGDGKFDLLWTARDSMNWVYIHFGSSYFDTIPSMRLRDPGITTFGFTLTNGGDMNGDGYPDIVVGCPYATITQGILFVFCGGPRIDGEYDARRSLSTNAKFGWSVSSTGDITGDGLAEIIAGAPEYPFGDNRGYWGVFKGDSTIRVTVVEEDGHLPQSLGLEQAYPNPFNPRTTIAYNLNLAAFVRVEVFNILGQPVKLLVNETQNRGRYQVEFNAGPLPSGVYYYRMTARAQSGSFFSETKSVTLIK